ncbi:hypothetical protein SRAA_0768 [Serpentinimonas raichei]|uniref:DUF3299 domain-containing protein n=1 Tax=Serpentinimonas raichei TaxID=1458425 RepID=A0A060NHK7_9BURK|nr:DUF3299 domain-containing protein [Serpentinimonas raichei]BAO80622.1 hypothetical protein SRAA_0768 [Serpentinimonas raichei]
MSIDEAARLDRRAWLGRAGVLAAGAAGAVAGMGWPLRAQAQTTPSGSAAPAGADGAAAAANPLAGGQGAGIHSPLSAYAPLPVRTDVIAWSTLADISTRTERNRVVQVYSPAILALDQRTVRLQGFMTPLDPGERQVHFLLTSVPLTCPFCTPGGPESIVQVRSRRPVRYTIGALVVEGRFHVLHNDSLGFFYRITGAVQVD